MTIRGEVIRLVNSAIACAEDDDYLIRRQFEGFSSEKMQCFYGSSGKTPIELLAESKEKLDRLAKCREWVENVEG